MEKLWEDVGHQKYIPVLYCDNDAAVQFAKDSKFHNKMKYIDLRYLFIRNDMIAKGRLQIQHLAGKDMVADILTKQLAAPAFVRHRNTLGLVNCTANTRKRRYEVLNNDNCDESDTYGACE
ncbi:hypothetical protein K3495_g9111 [Podosphaera aphanis]|nr:hypothetical protein K3495_g9111 [Podosphaera aphanis]